MPIVVGVIFKRAGKVYYFDPDGMGLKSGEKVIVKTSRGTEFGEVVSSPADVPDEEITAPLKKVVRKAGVEDKDQLRKNKEKEKEAFTAAEEKIIKHALPMKLIEVEYVFDRSKIIFYFTADGRIDFRDLVKDLAAVFKTRIELRQIGVRDEAKLVGGLGPCGQRLCCTVFLGDFEPVSIRMAKEQDLPLNPLKISGICGRLMCCLKYEYEVYQDFKKRAPRRGTKVTTEWGVARIVEFNVPKEAVIVELESGQRVEMPLEQAQSCACKKTCKEECGGKAKASGSDNGNGDGNGNGHGNGDTVLSTDQNGDLTGDLNGGLSSELDGNGNGGRIDEENGNPDSDLNNDISSDLSSEINSDLNDGQTDDLNSSEQ